MPSVTSWLNYVVRIVAVAIILFMVLTMIPETPIESGVKGIIIFLVLVTYSVVDIVADSL